MLCLNRSRGSRVHPVSNQRDLSIHVTYGKHKRFVPWPNDDQITTFTQNFLRHFNDVLVDGVTPSRVLFQQFDTVSKEYVGLTPDNIKELKGSAGPKLQALLESKCPHHVHPIKDGNKYQVWSVTNAATSGPLLQLQLGSPHKVSCDGHFGGPSGPTIITARELTPQPGIRGYALLFEDSGTQYAAKARGVGQDIHAEEYSPTELSRANLFKAVRFGVFTMFKSEAVDEPAFLGCDASQSPTRVTLVRNASLDHPNPETLFILHQLP